MIAILGLACDGTSFAMHQRASIIIPRIFDRYLCDISTLEFAAVPKVGYHVFKFNRNNALDYPLDNLTTLSYFRELEDTFKCTFVAGF